MNKILDTLLKISIALAIISFLLLNNFFCLFSNSIGFEMCLHSGFGIPKGKIYYISEILFGVALLIMVVAKSIYSKAFGVVFLSFTLFSFIPALLKRFSNMDFGGFDTIYLFYLLTFCFYLIVVFRRYRQPKST